MCANELYITWYVFVKDIRKIQPRLLENLFFPVAELFSE